MGLWKTDGRRIIDRQAQYGLRTRVDAKTGILTQTTSPSLTMQVASVHRDQPYARIAFQSPTPTEC
jgi:hypothetical protein